MQPSPVCRKHILVDGEEYVYKYMYKVRTNTKKYWEKVKSKRTIIQFMP